MLSAPDWCPGTRRADRGLGICDMASQIEDAGLESLFLVQNTHVPVSGTALLDVEHHERDHHFLDPFVALGAAAAVTTRIRPGTGICVAAIYDPVILAMQVSTIDQLSAGRLVFGIGVGHEDTVENHGVSPGLRGRVMREKVLAMKALRAAEDAEFHGEFVSFAPILTGLRPVQQPHPPILIGGQAAGESRTRRSTGTAGCRSCTRSWTSPRKCRNWSGAARPPAGRPRP